MCHYVSSACNSACRALKTLREHNQAAIGFEAREYLIGVERWIIAWTCRTPFAMQGFSEGASHLHECSLCREQKGEEGAEQVPHFRSSLSFAADPALEPTQ